MSANRNYDYVLSRLLRLGVSKGKWWLVIFALLGIGLVETRNAPALTSFYEPTIEAQLISVSDGDTIRVNTRSGQKKIRLAGIDAPERDQEFGINSKIMLSNFLDSKKMELVADGNDRYGRMVATIYVDNKNINLEMVRSGGAWMYRHYNKNPEFSAAEAQAKNMKVGLWSAGNPIRPWEWRKKKRQE